MDGCECSGSAASTIQTLSLVRNWGVGVDAVLDNAYCVIRLTLSFEKGKFVRCLLEFEQLLLLCDIENFWTSF